LLRAARRSPTDQSYAEAAEQLADFLIRRGTPSVPEDPPAVLTEAELRALLKGEDSDSLIGAIRRSWRVFIDTGRRISEVANLRSKRATATSV
jgi:integrase